MPKDYYACLCGREKSAIANCQQKNCFQREEREPIHAALSKRVAGYVDSILVDRKEPIDVIVTERKKMTKSMLSRPDLFWLGDLMRKHCASVNGFAVYEEGWSDERLLKELIDAGRLGSINNVRNLRLDLIGDIKKVSSQIANGVSPDDIRVINDKLDALHEENNELRGLMKKLQADNEVLGNHINALSTRLKTIEDWGRTRPHVPFGGGKGVQRHAGPVGNL